MRWDIPLFQIYWDAQDTHAIIDALEKGMCWAEGAKISEFEKSIAQHVGSKHCIVFNSGTSALHAALLAHGISQGDEVIVPSFTFIATANAPFFVQAKPVFADIEERTFGLNPEDVLEKITSRTKAIIPVHYGGCPCRIDELQQIAHDHDIILIEDAAEAFGATVRGRHVGTFGDSAMFSFCQNKIITTGEGGAMVTESDETAKRLRLIRSHGRDDSTQYFTSNQQADYITLGYNFRMPTMLAALGLAQMAKIDTILRLRKEKADYYSEKLQGMAPEIVPFLPLEGHDHVYQLYTMRARMRDLLMQHLADKGVMTKIYFKPVHTTNYYSVKLKYATKLPVTEKVSEEVLSLPMHPAISREEIDRVVSEIRSFYEGQ